MHLSEKIKQLAKEAPVISSGTNVNYGALTATPMVITFHGKKEKPDKRTLAEFAEFQEVEIEEVELGDNDQLQIHFAIDVQELNPNLSFQYWERDVALLANSDDGKRKTDWQEIVEPSLRKVFGPKWEEVLFGKDDEEPEPVYVACEVVDSLRVPKVDPATGQPGKNYGVPKFIQRFDGIEDCEAARDARYGKPGAPAEAADEEDIEDEVDSGAEEEDDDEKFPPNVLRQIYTLYKGSKDKKSTLALISKNKQWKQYDANKLLKEAIQLGESNSKKK